MLRRDLLKAAVAATLAPQCAMGQEASSASQPSRETPQATTPAGGNPPMRYRFGVNYVNTRDWLYFWNDFDAGQVARDLDAIAAMDMDHLRVFALWPYFQPWRNWVDPGYLRRLDKFMKLAAQRNLDVCLAMLNGWFSGSCLRPIFDEPQTFYTSPRMLESQQQYFRETAAVLKGHSNFLGFDIGNEMTCCWSTHEKTAEGDAWMEKSSGLRQSALPRAVSRKRCGTFAVVLPGDVFTAIASAVAEDRQHSQLYFFHRGPGTRRCHGPTLREANCRHGRPGPGLRQRSCQAGLGAGIRYFAGVDRSQAHPAVCGGDDARRDRRGR